MDSIPREALLVIAVVAVAFAAMQALASALRRWARSRRMSLRMERAAVGEQRAARWLEEHGYAITGAQVAVEHPVRVDDRTVVIALRADYLVERGGLRYVVEVKTGALAPRIETSATRRQMLEYRIAFDVDGVVLVDAETGRVHEVSFPALERLAPPSPRGFWIVTVAVAAAAAVIALVR